MGACCCICSKTKDRDIWFMPARFIISYVPPFCCSIVTWVFSINFLEYSKLSQACNCTTLLKRRLWHRCFSANFANFLRIPFTEHLWGTASILGLRNSWNLSFLNYFSFSVIQQTEFEKLFLIELVWKIYSKSKLFNL